MDKIRVLIAGACALALAGCQSSGGPTRGPEATGATSGGTGIVGEWAGTQPSALGGTTNVSVSFKSDGTYVEKTGTGQFAGEVDGTFTYDDSSKQITMNQNKMLLGGQEAKITGGSFPPGRPTPVTWTGTDQITIKMPLGDLSLKRK